MQLDRKKLPLITEFDLSPPLLSSEQETFNLGSTNGNVPDSTEEIAELVEAEI